MGLPKIDTPMEPVEVAGHQFTLRVLTRAEQFRIQKMVNSGVAEDELEIEALSIAMGVTADEVRAWYAETPAWVIKELIDHVQRISRLDEGAQKSGG